MKTWTSTAFLLLASLFSLTAFGLPERVGDFALLDSDGEFSSAQPISPQGFF